MGLSHPHYCFIDYYFVHCTKVRIRPDSEL